MKCPVCNGVDLLLSERQGIEIDYCPNCRGVWLDRGELDKIIERTAPVAGPEVQKFRQPEQQRHESHHPSYHDAPPRYQQQGGEHRHGHGHYHKKKKSFLSDIFDFD